jgi:response regulator RpfG family c-di-GMP phosphodiesterase
VSEAALARILCVDDEQRVLEGLNRTLFDHFEVVTESKPEQALERLRAPGEPFAVLVSDMRMPIMDGATLLGHARSLVPDTVRILLTGHADVGAAAQAVNQGRIFRFLSKPCAADVLITAITEAVGQHRLLLSERQLLEETLTGSIRLLSQVLGLVAPHIFSRTQRIEAMVKHMLRGQNHADPWKFTLAASLCMIGCVGLPEETVSRALAGLPLEPQDKQVFREHPTIAHRLLAPIPRFSEVAEMIRQLEEPQVTASSPDVTLGAQLLRLARDAELLVTSGVGIQEAIRKLSPRLSEPERVLIGRLRDFEAMTPQSSHVRSLLVRQLTGEMVLDEDVRTTTGVVVVPKGKQLNTVLLERLLRFTRSGGLMEPIRVLVPR